MLKYDPLFIILLLGLAILSAICLYAGGCYIYFAFQRQSTVSARISTRTVNERISFLLGGIAVFLTGVLFGWGAFFFFTSA